MENEVETYWKASPRNGYYAIDEFRVGRSGTFGNSLIVSNRKDAEKVAAKLNEAYERGRNDERKEHQADHICVHESERGL